MASLIVTLRAQSDGAVEDDCPGYDIKPSDGEAPVLELQGM